MSKSNSNTRKLTPEEQKRFREFTSIPFEDRKGLSMTSYVLQEYRRPVRK